MIEGIQHAINRIETMRNVAFALGRLDWTDALNYAIAELEDEVREHRKHIEMIQNLEMEKSRAMAENYRLMIELQNGGSA